MMDQMANESEEAEEEWDDPDDTDLTETESAWFQGFFKGVGFVIFGELSLFGIYFLITNFVL